MSKKISILLVLLLAVSALFAGCGGQPEEPAAERTLVVADESLGDELYGVGFRQGDVAFINELNRALNQIIEDGTAAEISTKWFGKDIVYVPETPFEEKTPAADDTSWTDIQANGKFVMGLDDEFPPMGFVREGEIVGFDVDMAKAVAEAMGIEVEFKPIVWDTKEMELINKNIDVVWNGLTMSEERVNSDVWGFSQPYLENRQVMVVWSDSGINAKADLAGKKVAAQLDSSGQAVVEADPDLMATFDGELITTGSYLDAMMELKAGSIDAIVGDEILARFYIEEDASNAAE